LIIEQNNEQTDEHNEKQTDLQNVISVPRANVSCFFYKRKLNVYNLTAHLCLDSQREGYCCIWNEGLAGRGANHIASALVAILKRVVRDHESIKHILLWSDSCVPQNRNSIMTTAILYFMRQHPTVTVEQKFCQPGHSSIQEVDNLHSQIEKRLKVLEVYSPISLMRVLLNVNVHNPFIVIQMKAADFLDYQHVSHGLLLKSMGIPYSRVKHIHYKNDDVIAYKTSFDEPDFVEVNIFVGENEHGVRQFKTKLQQRTLPEIQPCPPASLLSIEKQNDLRSMLKFMPEEDKCYTETLLKDSPTAAASTHTASTSSVTAEIGEDESDGMKIKGKRSARARPKSATKSAAENKKSVEGDNKESYKKKCNGRRSAEGMPQQSATKSSAENTKIDENKSKCERSTRARPQSARRSAAENKEYEEKKSKCQRNVKRKLKNTGEEKEPERKKCRIHQSDNRITAK